MIPFVPPRQIRLIGPKPPPLGRDARRRRRHRRSPTYLRRPLLKDILLPSPFFEIPLVRRSISTPTDDEQQGRQRTPWEPRSLFLATINTCVRSQESWWLQPLRLICVDSTKEFDAYHIADLARWALRHYNSNHPGAEFRLPDQPTTEAKAACVGFREDLWYHLNFSACPTGDGDEHNFFAEIRYDRCLDTLIIKTCIILEKTMCCFRSSCALCPAESKILHPSDVELGCGKEGHQEEFFRERCGWNGRVKEFFSPREMLAMPFKLGGSVPRYTLECP